MTYRTESLLREYLSFGDICQAEFLYDVHVRRDARALGSEETSAAFAKKRWGVDTAVRYYLPEVATKAGESFVLAHGVHGRAVVLADDCNIETLLGRDGGGPLARRLLFAPLVEIDDGELESLLAGSFARCPLEADEQDPKHYAVELRKCFMVDARDVDAALKAEGFRVRSLDDAARSELAIRLSAYAVRRGPLVAEDSADKFAGHLVDVGRSDEDAAVEAGRALAEVVAAAWVFEGEALERAGNAATDHLDADEVISYLIEQLEALCSASNVAIDALRAA